VSDFGFWISSIVQYSKKLSASKVDLFHLRVRRWETSTVGFSNNINNTTDGQAPAQISTEEIIQHSPDIFLLEELPVVQLVKNFPAFYGTRRFNTVFTVDLHWSLTSAQTECSLNSRLFFSFVERKHVCWNRAFVLMPFEVSFSDVDEIQNHYKWKHREHWLSHWNFNICSQIKTREYNQMGIMQS
jgi:hypothetical protein